VCIRYRGNVSTEPLPSTDRRIFTEPLPSNDKGMFTEPLPSNYGGGGDTHTYTHTGQRDSIFLNKSKSHYDRRPVGQCGV
jgi:hypothetical protein